MTLGEPAAQRALLAWSDRHRRDLPWRDTRDPWGVLVSEVMLQQTQVTRVVPRWHAFLDRFPTPGACAAAPVGEVVVAWSGLGYNRRAVALHRAAVACVEQHRGELPEDLDALLALPGVGPYTARAVLAFAFEHDVGVVDTNVGRLLARLEGRALRPAEAQALADASVPPGTGWAWNQALFDLGAALCTKRAPACVECPLRSGCSWRGGPGPDPAVGSAAVGGGQSRFEGSDRQGRGRLVAALGSAGCVGRTELAVVAGWPGDAARARRVAESLVVDGLASWQADGSLVLPPPQTGSRFRSPEG